MRLPLKYRLYSAAGRYLPFLKLRPPDVDRSAALRLRPGRNSLLTWEKKETGETVLAVPMNHNPKRWAKWFGKWLRFPEERYVELDEVGGFVWELCDGKHSVESIVQLTSKQYKMNRREAEISVTTFLQMLHQRNFIGFYKKVGKKS
jgi:hypothetical protein